MQFFRGCASIFEHIGGFLKWGYPQIIHLNRIFHDKPSILGYLPIVCINRFPLFKYTPQKPGPGVALDSLQRAPRQLQVSIPYPFRPAENVWVEAENPWLYDPIGSMYGIYANIWGILMVNVTIYSSTMDPMGMVIHGHSICFPHEKSAFSMASPVFRHTAGSDLGQ